MNLSDNPSTLHKPLGKYCHTTLVRSFGPCRRLIGVPYHAVFDLEPFDEVWYVQQQGVAGLLGCLSVALPADLVHLRPPSLTNPQHRLDEPLDDEPLCTVHTTYHGHVTL